MKQQYHRIRLFLNPHDLRHSEYHDFQGGRQRESEIQRDDQLIYAVQLDSMYLPNTMWTRTFFGITVLQAALCLTMEAFIFAKFDESLRGRARTSHSPIQSELVLSYLTIFMFGFCYQVILVWDALRCKNTIQVIGIGIYNLGLLVYATMESIEIERAITILLRISAFKAGARQSLHLSLLIAPIILAVGTLLLSLVAWKLYTEFAWVIYKQISADIRLKKRYRTYQVLSKLSRTFHIDS